MKENNGKDIRRARFESVFGQIDKQVDFVWFQTYCDLLAGGDTHGAAVQTIRGEMGMLAQLVH